MGEQFKEQPYERINGTDSGVHTNLENAADAWLEANGDPNPIPEQAHEVVNGTDSGVHPEYEAEANAWLEGKRETAQNVGGEALDKVKAMAKSESPIEEYSIPESVESVAKTEAEAPVDTLVGGER